VHETYLKFLRADSVSAGSREHFYRLASRAMRQILLDRARIAAADKRPASAARLSLDDALRHVDNVIGVGREELIDIDRALGLLEGLDARLAEVAQLHLFAGLEFQEIAALRGVSERTVLRDWRKARAILVSQLEPPATP
jgi:RNA polymerase sigma factor (TIGR02999 family)